MIGTMENDIIVDQVTSQDIVVDSELGKDEVVDVKDRELNKQKLRRRIDQYKYLISRFGFFSMKWVELEMGEFGVLNNPNYKITALLDHLLTVQSDNTRGIFDCKQLGLIWAHYCPEFYNAQNTIVFDDLRRNFTFTVAA